MKAFGLLALLLVSGIATASSQYGSSNNRTEYTCDAYTSNSVNGNYSTDNAQQRGRTVVVETPGGYTIRPGVLYNHPVELSNNAMLTMGQFAGDKGHLIAAKQNAAGMPYFVIWEFDESMVDEVDGVATPKKGALKKIITLAECAAK